MIEPLTLGVADLATRWNLTPRQVLQHAVGLGVPLYFAFEGLAFDIGDEWRRANGDWQQRHGIDSLGQFIKAAESQLQKRARGALSQWETLSSEEAIELRTRVDDAKRERDSLAIVLEQRENERNRCTFRGFLRAPPCTLWDIDSLGSAPFPHKAFHPSSPVTVVTLSDGRGHDGEQIWDGRLMALEPMTGHDRYSKDSLTADDLCASFEEVKGIEACIRAKQPKASPEPQQADAETAPAIAEPMLTVTVNADVESDSALCNASVGRVPPLPEEPADRDDRRYRELRAMGGDYVNQGTQWRVTGPRGELAKLCKREKAAGRPMSDDKDVREGLKKAATRADGIKAAGSKGNSAFNQ